MITGADIYRVLSSVLPLYVSIFLGYASIRIFKILTLEQCAGVNRYVALIAVPALGFQIIAETNVYQMNWAFLGADAITKAAALLALYLWAFLSPRRGRSRQWVEGWAVTIFMVSALPNTLVIGVPLLTAMYGPYAGELMAQIVVIQVAVWFPLVLLLLGLQGAREEGMRRMSLRLSAREQPPEAAHPPPPTDVTQPPELSHPPPPTDVTQPPEPTHPPPPPEPTYPPPHTELSHPPPPPELSHPPPLTDVTQPTVASEVTGVTQPTEVTGATPPAKVTAVTAVAQPKDVTQSTQVTQSAGVTEVTQQERECPGQEGGCAGQEGGCAGQEGECPGQEGVCESQGTECAPTQEGGCAGQERVWEIHIPPVNGTGDQGSDHDHDPKNTADTALHQNRPRRIRLWNPFRAWQVQGGGEGEGEGAGSRLGRASSWRWGSSRVPRDLSFGANGGTLTNGGAHHSGGTNYDGAVHANGEHANGAVHADGETHAELRPQLRSNSLGRAPSLGRAQSLRIGWWDGASFTNTAHLMRQLSRGRRQLSGRQLSRRRRQPGATGAAAGNVRTVHETVNGNVHGTNETNGTVNEDMNGTMGRGSGAGGMSRTDRRALLGMTLRVIGMKLLTNPNNYAALLGVAYSLLSFGIGFGMPEMLKNSIAIVGNTGLGMAMFSLGLFMASQRSLLPCGTWTATWTLLLRFVAAPLLTAGAALAVGLRGTVFQIAVVQAALPPGIANFVFANEYKVNPSVLSTGVSFGTLISFPILLVLYILLGL